MFFYKTLYLSISCIYRIISDILHSQYDSNLQQEFDSVVIILLY